MFLYGMQGLLLSSLSTSKPPQLYPCLFHPCRYPHFLTHHIYAQKYCFCMLFFALCRKEFMR